MKRLAIVLSLSASIASAQQSEPIKNHSFNDRENLALWSADALVRTLDWQSTRMLLSNPCKCFYEKQLPPGIVQSSGRMLAYSLAVSGAVHYGAYLAHRTGHHRIERLIPLMDIAGDGEAVVGNYAISGRRSK